MNSVFKEALDHFCTVYLNDILVYSSSNAQHLQHIEWVLSKLKSNSLFAKPTKFEFGLTELEYLGCIISSSNIKCNHKKTEAIKLWTSPTYVRILQVFLGFCNYYGRFVHHFADIAAPLYASLFEEVS